jgi:hypothetical protein
MTVNIDKSTRHIRKTKLASTWIQCIDILRNFFVAYNMPYLFQKQDLQKSGKIFQFVLRRKGNGEREQERNKKYVKSRSIQPSNGVTAQIGP